MISAICGMADDVWIFNVESGKWQRLFENKAQDIMPMWHGSKIYFISDRDQIFTEFPQGFIPITKPSTGVQDVIKCTIFSDKINGYFPLIVFKKGANFYIGHYFIGLGMD